MTRKKYLSAMSSFMFMMAMGMMLSVQALHAQATFTSPVTSFAAHDLDINTVVFSPDGEYVLTASGDRTAKVWTKDGSLMYKLGDHLAQVTTAAFSPDGKYIATSSGSGAKIWDAQTGKHITTHKDYFGVCNSVAFSPDSKHLMSGGNTRTMGWKWKPIFINEQLPPPPPKATTLTPTVMQIEKTPEVEEKKAPIAKEETVAKKQTLEELKLTYTTRNIPDSLGDRRVRSGKRVVVGSEDIEIAVWDEEIVDGDIISIFLNGEWLLKEYTLKKKKKTRSVHHYKGNFQKFWSKTAKK